MSNRAVKAAHKRIRRKQRQLAKARAKVASLHTELSDALYQAAVAIAAQGE